MTRIETENKKTHTNPSKFITNVEKRRKSEKNKPTTQKSYFNI